MRAFSTALALVLLASMAFAGNYSVVPVQYAAFSADDYRIATAPGNAVCGASPSQDWSYNGAKMIEIRSCAPIFGGPADALIGPYSYSRLLFDPIGLTNNGSTSLNGQYYQSTDQSKWKPRVFYKIPGRDCLNWNYVSEMIAEVRFPDYPPSLSTGIYLEPSPAPASSSGELQFGEYAGPNMLSLTRVPFIADNPSSPTITFNRYGGFSPPYVLHYNGNYPTGFASYELPFITERGSRWLSISNTEVSFQVAAQIAEPEFHADLDSSRNFWANFNTLISDTLDRTPKNRYNTMPEDQWAASLSDDDTIPTASPLRAAEPNTMKAKNLYAVCNSAFCKQAGSYPGAYGSISAIESFWFGTPPNGVAYDSSSTVRDVAVNKYSALAYSLKYVAGGTNSPASEEYGIPVCAANLAQAGNWASCTNIADRVDSQQYAVRFMGSDWLISNMTPPSSPLASSVSAMNGGEVTLSKGAAKIILRDGSRYNLVPLTDPNRDVLVSLLWKNRDYASGGSTQPDSLREIVIYRLDGFSKVVKGNSVSLLNTNITYLGITPVLNCTIVSPPVDNSSCNETDGGANIYVRGTASGRNASGTFSKTDVCASSKSVYEYFCEGKTLRAQAMPCPENYSCVGGACQQACNDTDGGFNIFVKGSTYALLNPTNPWLTDYCEFSGTLREFYCENGTVGRRSVNCPSGMKCLDGACVALIRSVQPANAGKTATSAVAPASSRAKATTHTAPCRLCLMRASG